MNFRHGPKISYLTNNENYQHIRRIDSRSCAPSPGGSQRINELVSDRSYKPDSTDATKRISPLAPFFCQNLRQLRHISIIISARYNFTDRKNRPFGLQLLRRLAQRKAAYLRRVPQNPRLLHIHGKWLHMFL